MAGSHWQEVDMKTLNKDTFKYFLGHNDGDIKGIAEAALEHFYKYAALLSKGSVLNYYSGDLDVIRNYDTSRRIEHDCVISSINTINRLAMKENKELLLDIDNMTREDVANAVVLYCEIDDNKNAPI